MFNIKYIFSYLFYVLFARHKYGHGIHSPFIFNLIKEVLNDKNEYDAYKKVEKLKERLLLEERIVKITFQGAGSKYTRQNFRKLNNITKRSSIQEKYGRLLYRLVHYLKPEKIIELGTAVGISASYMAYGYPKALLYTIEGDKNILDIAKTNFKIQGLNQIQTFNEKFKNILKSFLSEIGQVDFVLIDGDHRGEALIQNFEIIKKYTHNDSVIVIDDIRWSEDMLAAWKKIINDKMVSVTLDLFHLGIVFFRKESSKQNFIIKY